MPIRNVSDDDPLEDFDPRVITLDGVANVVHVAGSGRAVIVMSEMPGISPHVARFSRWVRDPTQKQGRTTESVVSPVRFWQSPWETRARRPS